MRIDKKLWREMLQRNAENEFRIARLELKIGRLESLLEKEIKSSECELEVYIDALLNQGQIREQRIFFLAVAMMFTFAGISFQMRYSEIRSYYQSS